MLQYRDCTSAGNTYYTCDRCQEKLRNTDRWSVYIGKGRTPAKKKWDLCDKCYKALQRGIRKGV